MVNNWIAVLNQVMAQADEKTRFISCHGWTVMTKAQRVPQVAYLEKLWNKVKRAKAVGKTLQQAKGALPRQAFPEVGGLADTGLQL